MPTPQEMLERVKHDFTNHPPTGEGVSARLDEATQNFIAMASWIVEHVPPGREQSLALTNLEQTSMWTKAGIARNQGG